MLRLGFSTLGQGARKILIPTTNIEIEQIRTTFIVKRRWEPNLQKAGRPPKPLKARHHVYDTVENTEVRKWENIDVVLTTFVEGLGLKGDIVSVRPNYGRDKLLLTGLAVYASPENIAKYQESRSDSDVKQHSSRFAPLTVKALSRVILNLPMNKETPWTVEKFHVRAAFRRTGFWVPDEAFELPEKPINGPDLSLENKDFIVKVKINNLEEAFVRCRIHHWSTELKNRLPYRHRYWEEPSVPLFEEDRGIIEKLPPPTSSATNPLATAS